MNSNLSMNLTCSKRTKFSHLFSITTIISCQRLPSSEFIFVIKRNMHKGTITSVSNLVSKTKSMFVGLRTFARAIGSPVYDNSTVYEDQEGNRTTQVTHRHAHMLDIDDNTGKAKFLGVLTTKPQPEKFESVDLDRGTLLEPESKDHQFLAISSKMYEFEKDDYNIWPESGKFLSDKAVQLSKLEPFFKGKLAGPVYPVTRFEQPKDFFTVYGKVRLWDEQKPGRELDALMIFEEKKKKKK